MAPVRDDGAACFAEFLQQTVVRSQFVGLGQVHEGADAGVEKSVQHLPRLRLLPGSWVFTGEEAVDFSPEELWRGADRVMPSGKVNDFGLQPQAIVRLSDYGALCRRLRGASTAT